MAYGSRQHPPESSDWGGSTRQYGYMEEPEDQVVDPRVLAAESRRLAQEHAARGGRSAVSLLWTREGGLERVSRPHPPEPPASRVPPRQDEEDGPVFSGMEFHEPPPPLPAVGGGEGWPVQGWPEAGWPQQGGSW